MARPQKLPTLSIIVPTLDEASHLPLLFADLNLWPYEYDLMIVDGGSKDLTVSIAKIQGVNILKSPKKSRGYQLKIGASKAKGDWLLFLHADSRLDPEWANSLLKIISKKSSKDSAWYFDFKVNRKEIIFRLLEIAVFIRSNLLKEPYGDQGLLISKELYLSTGGYKDLYLMEDLDFVQRLARARKLRGLGVCLITHGRKWSKGGVIKNAIKNASLRTRWRNGASTKMLFNEYYSRS